MIDPLHSFRFPFKSQVKIPGKKHYALRKQKKEARQLEELP
jgi:hypothetical protein